MRGTYNNQRRKRRNEVGFERPGLGEVAREDIHNHVIAMIDA